MTDSSRVIPEGSPFLSREPNCIDLAGSAERREEGMSLSVSPGPWELRTGGGPNDPGDPTWSLKHPWSFTSTTFLDGVKNRQDTLKENKVRGLPRWSRG